jgi:DNA/RNA endonuclease YhcR with UshA esterase domain
VFGDPLQKFGYHTIEVSGLIRMYEGHPEIIVNVPTEIAVIQ